MSLRPRVDARSFRQIMVLQTQAKGQDQEGQQSGVWREFMTIRCDLHSVNGREFIAAQAQQAGATHWVETHWLPDFADFRAMDARRGVIGTRVFDIKTCDNVDEMNRLCRMMATEGLRS